MPMSDWMVGGGMATVFLSTIALVAATNISISSAPVVLWSAVDTLHKCGFIDVPDIPLRVFSPAPGDVRAVVGSTNYHRMSGSSIFSLNRSCAYAWNETGYVSSGFPTA